MSGTYSNAPCIEKRYKNFPLHQQFFEEFLMNSLFHQTKIPTMDIKVLMYFNLTNFFLEKHKISKLYEEWKISPSQVQGQGLQNWRGNSQRIFLKPPYSSCPPFWAAMVNSYWLATALAYLAQISYKISNTHNFLSVGQKL